MYKGVVVAYSKLLYLNSLAGTGENYRKPIRIVSVQLRFQLSNTDEICYFLS
jgi:hypothetical protein